MKPSCLATRAVVGLTISVCCVVLAPVEQSRTAGARTQSENKERYERIGAEATVTGKVLFDGDVPARKKIDMSHDANCADIARNPRTDYVIATDGKLANVFVYLRGGSLDRFTFETPQTGIVLDQRQCRFVPRVLGIQTGQILTVLNSDPTTHNVHPVPLVNPEWNQMQTPNARPLEKAFSRPETLIPVKCNLHPWMRAYVGVLAHPFFAVSARDGSFWIDGLPPGEYTLVAWHETLGEQTTSIALGAREKKTVDFMFNSRASDPSSASFRTGKPLVIQ
jgi:plastocyanin